jgi:biotin operon repressor
MKITAERLTDVADYVLQRGGVISGTQVGREIGVSIDTLWKNLRKRGMQPAQARDLAQALDREATNLRTAARDLRAAAGGD